MGKSQLFNAINRDLLSFKAFYFFFLSAFGSLFPYLPIYFRQVGLSAHHVGLLIGLRPIVQLASAPFWAIMADKYKKRKFILIMSIIAWLVMTLALAFVEPTDGICEFRAENATTSRFVNYTKIKTGFFRRSFETSGQGFVEETSPDLVAIPLRRVFIHDAYKLEPRLPQSAFERYNSHDSIVSATKVTLGNNTKANLTSTLEIHSLSDGNITESLQENTQVNGKEHKIGRTGPRNNHIDVHNNNYIDVSAIMRNKDFQSRFKEYDYHSKIHTRKLPRVIRTKTSAKSFESKAKKLLGFSDNKFGQMIKKSDKNTGAQLTEANNQYNVVKEEHHERDFTLTSHKTKQHQTKSMAVEFSKVDFDSPRTRDEKVPHTKSRTDNVSSGSGNGSGELEVSGIQEIEINGNNTTKDIKKATQRLRLQLAKSVNFLSHMTDNSDKNLLHKTITMFSNQNGKTLKGAKDQGNNSQLFDAFKNLIESSQKYVSFDASGENSTEGSSALDTKHDFTNLAHLMINQKDDLKALDRLHQEKAGNYNKDVIHHSILPNHVLHSPYTNKTAVLPSIDYVQNQSYYGEDVNYSSDSEQTLKVKLNKTSNFFIENDKNSSSKEKDLKETKSAHSGDDLLNATQIWNMEKFEHGNLLGQGNLEPPSSVSSVNQIQLKLKNLLKSNKLELSRMFMIFFILVVVGEFLESPSFTLADASLLEILGENRGFYGRQRLWGSIGFGVCSFIVGLLLERSNHVVCGEQYTDYMICFCAFGIMMLLTLFVTTSFDFHYSDLQSSSCSVLSALCNLHYGSCLLAACVMGIDFSLCNNFLTWFLEDLGASKSLMGLAVVSRALADTITFYFAGSIIKAIGQIRVMILVFISYTVILLTLSTLHNPWWVILIEILDGITYAMAWSACTSYLAGAVPAESVTTLQGILQGIYWGLGSGSGTITGGYLIHHIGAVTTFRVTAAFTFTVFLLFSTIQWKWTNGTTNEYPQTKYTYLPAVESKDTEALLSGYDLPRNKRKSGRIKTKFSDPY